jgi:hypothetical protein
MFTRLPAFILGFDGCDAQVAQAVLAGESQLKPSKNTYDWLGEGVYFWEQNPLRALEFAREMMSVNTPSGQPRIKKPAVIGAVIDLGICLNLLDSKFLKTVSQAHASLLKLYEANGKNPPVNKQLRNSTDLIFRYLDCDVIEMIHENRRSTPTLPAFDTVRAVFVEGKPLYENAGFHEKNHIQICVRNPTSIQGVFRVDDSHLIE